MAVLLKCKGGSIVAEIPLNSFNVIACLDGRSRISMSQIMEALTVTADLFYKALKVVIYRDRRKMLPDFIGKDKIPLVVKSGADSRKFSLFSPLLSEQSNHGICHI